MFWTEQNVSFNLESFSFFLVSYRKAAMLSNRYATLRSASLPALNSSRSRQMKSRHRVKIIGSVNITQIRPDIHLCQRSLMLQSWSRILAVCGSELTKMHLEWPTCSANTQTQHKFLPSKGTLWWLERNVILSVIHLNQWAFPPLLSKAGASL